MAESGEDYNPGAWKGWDHEAARKHHVDPTAGRGYALQSALKNIPDKKKDPDPIVPVKKKGSHIAAKLETTAKSPVVIATDVTGSMGVDVETIFKKLPLVDDGLGDYLEDPQLAFLAVGDARTDRVPLQGQPFSKGKDLVDKVLNLEIEGGGGGNNSESYELAALYGARNIEMPNAIKPIFIFICDEGVPVTVDKGYAKDVAKVDLTEKLTAADVFAELKKKFSVYCIRKHYIHAGTYIDGDKLVGLNKVFHEQWTSLVGADRVVLLDDAKRVADVILGILAVDSGKEDFFKKEITARQTKDQVDTVMKAMTSIKKDQAKPSGDQNLSVTKKQAADGKSVKAKSLL